MEAGNRKIIPMISIFLIGIYSLSINSQPNTNFNKKAEKLWNYGDESDEDGEFIKDSLLGYKSSLPKIMRIFKPKSQEIKIDPFEDNRFTGEKGFEFLIPANSLALPNKFKKGDKVNLSLIEVIESIDLITSGIDMSYTDRIGRNHIFESGGMYKLEALYKSRPIQLKTGSKITVIAPYLINSPKSMNVYEYDDSIGTWDERGKEERKEEVIEGEGSIFVRFFSSIKSFEWHNFDYPNSDTTCIKGSVNPISKNTSYSVFAIGIDYLGSTMRSFSENEFAMNTLRNKDIKIVVIDNKGNIAKSDVIKTSGSKFFIKENKQIGKCMDIGKFKINPPDHSIWKNKNDFIKYLDI